MVKRCRIGDYLTMMAVGPWIERYLQSAMADVMEDLHLNAVNQSTHVFTIYTSDIENRKQITLAHMCRAGPSTIRILFKARFEEQAKPNYITARVHIRQ